MKETFLRLSSSDEPCFTGGRGGSAHLPAGADSRFIRHFIYQEFTLFDFVPHQLSASFEAGGNGTGRDNQFRFHLVRDAAHPLRLLKSLDAEGRPVLPHAYRPPQVRLNQIELAQSSGPTIITPAYKPGSQARRSRRNWLSTDFVDEIPTTRLDFDIVSRPKAGCRD